MFSAILNVWRQGKFNLSRALSRVISVALETMEVAAMIESIIVFESRTALPLIAYFPYNFGAVAVPRTMSLEASKEFIEVINGFCRFRGTCERNNRLVRTLNRYRFCGNNDRAVKSGFYRIHSFTIHNNSVFGKAKPAGSDTRNQPHLDSGKAVDRNC